jgi:hypothetical protein
MVYQVMPMNFITPYSPQNNIPNYSSAYSCTLPQQSIHIANSPVIQNTSVSSVPLAVSNNNIVQEVKPREPIIPKQIERKRNFSKANENVNKSVEYQWKKRKLNKHF